MKEISGEDRTAKPERTALWYLVVLVGAGVFYVVSCAPTILWQEVGCLADKCRLSSIIDKAVKQSNGKSRIGTGCRNGQI